YGETETVWVSSKDYARQVARREPLKAVQIEDLRLVPDDRWYQAQALLVKEAGKVAGRKPRDGDAASRPRVLNGLFYCPAHNRKLYVGGVDGKYLVCKDCRGLPADRRPAPTTRPGPGRPAGGTSSRPWWHRSGGRVASRSPPL